MELQADGCRTSRRPWPAPAVSAPSRDRRQEVARERRPVPVFDGDHITLQAVRTCQQVFSAAFIAHIEATVNDDERRNALCTPVPHPDTDVDFLRTTLVNTTNLIQWMQDAELAAWLRRSRLDVFTPPPGEDLPDIDPAPMLQAIPNLQRLQAAADRRGESARSAAQAFDRP